MKKLLAILLAAAMLLSLAGCGLFEGSKSTEPASTTGEPDATGDPTGNDDTNYPEHFDFDFGVIKFSAGEFDIEWGESANIGGNMGKEDGTPGDEGAGAAGAIRIAGFQGYKAPDGGYPDDPESKYLTLISQNGPFWENLVKIEASFYIVGGEDAETDDIGNIETFYQDGRDGGWNWKNFGGNLLEQTFDPDSEDEDDGFEFGDIMTATWIMEEFLAKDGVNNAVFGNPPKEKVEGDGDWGGGGLSKFGVQIQNDGNMDGFQGEIRWTDVKIYVKSLEKFMEFVDMVEEKTEGRNKLDEDLKDKIIEVS